MRDSSLPNRAERLAGLDVLRWLAFQAVLIFHLTYALWAHYGLVTVPFRGWLSTPLELYARGLAFSGFAILALSFFLYGWRGSRKKFWLPLLLLGCGLLWQLSLAGWPPEWDIYPFLLCAAVLVWLTGSLPAGWVAAVSAVMLCVPFWRWENALDSLAWRTVLVGACEIRSDLGEWPLLPWVFLPTLMFAVGRMMQGRSLKTIGRIETLVWAAALGFSGPFVGGYYATTLGEEFGCFVFRRPPEEFVAQGVWWACMVRLSFLSRVPARLAEWASSSPVNQHFWLVYGLHYPLVFVVAALARRWEWDHQPWILGAAYLTTTLAIEGCGRLAHNSIRTEWGWARINAKSSTT